MDDASNDDNNSSLAPDARADRSLPSEAAPQVIFVGGDVGPLLCVACGSPIGGDEAESTATVVCPGCGKHYRVVRSWKRYEAIIWIGDEPGKRVSVVAKNLQEARDLLTEEYGTGHVVSLWNEADLNRPR